MAESADCADLSRVIALTNKGTELALKGHHARAAAKLALAAEEAERVLPGSQDCLITAALRAEQIDTLLSYSTASAAKPADANDVLRKACFHLLPAVVDVLERRKAAGTLLPGTCRSVEVAWFKAERRHCRLQQGMSLTAAEEGSTRSAPYVGYTTFMRIAASLAFVLNNIVAFKYTLNLSDEEMDVHTSKAMLFLASALDMMTLPRPRAYEKWVAGEPEVVRLTGNFSPVFTSMAEDGDYPEAQQLHNAWQRVQRSGVLRVRGIEEGIEEVHQHHLIMRAVAHAALAAGRLRTCALASCAAGEAHLEHFKSCAACRTVCYCSREHQVQDWPAHKAACKAARKAAEARATGPADA